MSINDNLTYSLSLIKKRKELLTDIQQKEQYVVYLNSPVLSKSDYNFQNNTGGRNALRVTSNVVAVVAVVAGILTFLLVIIAFVSGSSDRGEFNYSLFIIPFILLIISAILGTIASVLRATAYSNYLENDKQYRTLCHNQLSNYLQKQEELKKLETLMSNPSICIIPKAYWDDADYIAGYIKSGQAKTVEEAISYISNTRYK